MIHVRLYLIATVSKLRYDWTCQLESEQGPNPRWRFTAAEHVKDQTGFRSMYFGVGLLLHYVIKAKQEPWNQDSLKSRVPLRWQDKNPDSCISSFRHLPSGRKCNSSQGEIPIPYRVRVFFLYYLDNELNVPWRMLKG